VKKFLIFLIIPVLACQITTPKQQIKEGPIVTTINEPITPPTVTTTPEAQGGWFYTEFDDLRIRDCKGETVSDPEQCEISGYLKPLSPVAWSSIRLFETGTWFCLNQECTILVGGCVREENLANICETNECQSIVNVCRYVNGE
jgi:hypothetical protein